MAAALALVSGIVGASLGLFEPRGQTSLAILKERVDKLDARVVDPRMAPETRAELDGLARDVAILRADFSDLRAQCRQAVIELKSHGGK